MEEAFVGILERNDWEGCKMGYYFSVNEEGNLRRLFEAYKKKLPDLLGDDWGQYEFLFESVAKSDLDVLNEDQDDDAYKPRVSYMKKPDWDALIKEVENGEDILYKGGDLETID